MVPDVSAVMMPLTTFHFLKNEVSIYSGLIGLFDEGHLGLFFILLIFSVCFPLAKIFTLAYVWYGESTAERRKTVLHWIETLGRWSMLDVFVVALTIVAIEISLISDVTTHAGLYVFTAAVVLSMLAVRRILVLAKRAAS